MAFDPSAANAHEQRLDEAAAEYLRLAGASQCASREEFLARYPELAPDLEAFLDDCDRMKAWAQLVREAEASKATSSDLLLSSSDTQSDSASTGPHLVGRFELIEKIGEGAFSRVYRACDPKLERPVAVKIPHRRVLTCKKDLARFEREAHSLSLLKHPAIVPVHDFGEANGVPYLVSDFISGQTLSQILTAQAVSCREAAHVVAAIAEALHYAHAKGVIHRDVKSSNIMLGDDGKPYLIDFGLAYRVGVDATLTTEGQRLGTAAYMSPEQARGDTHQADAATDVYSLGLVLYELLTGARPFQGPVETILHQVLHDDPKPPRHLKLEVPRDLETICLRAMAKEPAQRYATAGALSEDLRRFLDGKPIQARRAGMSEHTWKWVRRHPSAGVWAASVLLFLASMAGMLRLQQLNEDYDRKAHEARLLEYSRDIPLVRDQLNKGNLAGAFALLQQYQPKPGQADVRGFEWFFLSRLQAAERVIGQGGNGPVHSVAFSPDGKWLAWGDHEGHVQIWDVAKGRIRHALPPQRGEILSMAFSSDSKLLATGGGVIGLSQICVWQVDSGERVTHFNGRAQAIRVYSLAFDPTNTKSLVAATTVGPTQAGQIWLLDVETESLRDHWFCKPAYYSNALAFSPDGKTLAAVTSSDSPSRQSSQVLLWSWNQKQPRETLDLSARVLERLAFAPDGKTLALGSKNGDVQLLDVVTGANPATLASHAQHVQGMAFTLDGGTLAVATGSEAGLKGTGVVTLWYPLTRTKRADIPGPPGGFRSLAYSPDGKTLALGCEDGTLRLWDPFQRAEALQLASSRAKKEVWGLAYSPDHRLLASSSDNGIAELWDAKTHQLLGTLFANDKLLSCLAFSPDGKLLATGGYDNVVRIWDIATGQESRSMVGHKRALRSVAFSPDGKLLVTGAKDDDIRVWDVATGACKVRLPRGWTDAILFIPGTDRFVSSGEDGRLLITDIHRPVSNLQDLHSAELATDQAELSGLALTPDGKLLVSGNYDGRVRMWNLESGKLVREFYGHDKSVMTVAVSPDGRTVAAAGISGIVRLWQLHTGQELLQLAPIGCQINRLVFSADGQTLVGSCHDGMIRFWSAPR